MKLTHKTLGLSVIAVAATLFTTATFADNMGRMGMGMGDGMGLATADANADGAISKEEFEAWRASRLTVVDADKDGLVSVEELVTLRTKQAETQARTMAERMVAAHDGNADGKLSAEELVQLPTPGFDRLDSNGDGTISADEMPQGRGEGRGHGKGGRHHRGEAPQD